MKRLAILIGSPSDPKTPEAGKYLKGVKTDIENIHGFLTSSIGGSWKSGEVICFPPNPSYAIVSPYLKACESVDFSFVYFSGHGYTDSNENSIVQLNPQETLNVIKDLAKRSSKQVTIIDACRNYPKYSGFDGLTLLEGIDFPNPQPEFARAVYDNYLSLLPASRVLLCATSVGKFSMDYGENYGGLFSTNLLSVVKSKLETENKAIFDVAEVFQRAKINTQIIEPKQVPKIYVSDNNAYSLPFAVKPSYRPPLKTQKPVLKESNTTLIENIAKGAIIGGSILLAGYVIGSILTGKKK